MKAPLSAIVVPLCLSALLLLPYNGSAQVVAGRVIDIGTESGVVGAQVSLVDPEGRIIRSAVTDSSGVFTVPVVEPDSYTVQVDHVAYGSTTSEWLMVRRNETVEVEIRVGQQEIPLEPLVVTARRSQGNAYLEDFYRRAEINEDIKKGVILTRSDLDPLDGLTVLDAFSREPIRFRRPNPMTPCVIRTYWNGLLVEEVTDDQWRGRMQGGSTKRGGTHLYEIPVSTAEGVEIYDDMLSVPAEYFEYRVRHLYEGPDGAQFAELPLCGVILTWSRPMRPGEGRNSSWLVRGLAAVGAFALLVFVAQ
jgi:hypothetical protein